MLTHVNPADLSPDVAALFARADAAMGEAVALRCESVVWRNRLRQSIAERRSPAFQLYAQPIQYPLSLSAEIAAGLDPDMFALHEAIREAVNLHRPASEPARGTFSIRIPASRE